MWATFRVNIRCSAYLNWRRKKNNFWIWTGCFLAISVIQEHESISEHLLSFYYRIPAAGTKLIVEGLQYYGKAKKFLDTWLQDIVLLLFWSWRHTIHQKKIIYCSIDITFPFETWCVFQFVFFFFLNPDLIHLLEVCMIPAGLATFSVVFIGLQTSILCFPCVIFISRFDSKQDIYQTIL